MTRPVSAAWLTCLLLASVPAAAQLAPRLNRAFTAIPLGGAPAPAAAPAQAPVPAPAGAGAAQAAPAQAPATAPAAGLPSGLPPGLPPGAIMIPWPGAAATPAEPLPLALTLDAGTGQMLQLPAPATTVMAADPRIARVQAASPTRLFLIAVGAGHTTVIATNDAGMPVAHFDVTVRSARPDPAAAPPGAPREERPAAGTPNISPAAIEAGLHQMLPAAAEVRVRGAPGALLLTGPVPTPADAQRVVAMAQGFAGQDRQIVNEMEVLASVQVNLRVRVAEISRQVTRELGFNWMALGRVGSFALGLRSGANASSVLTSITGATGAGAASVGRLGMGFQNSRNDINAIIDALAADQLITILAEPNLTAQSGETASFLAGGEFPVPVAANLTGQVSIEFKQFGVSLAFIPTVLSAGRINLRVRPEVSQLSDVGSISLPISGGTLQVPALSVRRAETTVELGSGQSFAIAGLLQRNITQNTQGLAGLGEIPILGALFRSNRFQRNETELVIIVTPYLVRPVSDPAALGAPTDGFRPATDLDRVLRTRQIAAGAPASRLRPVDAGFILEPQP